MDEMALDESSTFLMEDNLMNLNFSGVRNTSWCVGSCGTVVEDPTTTVTNAYAPSALFQAIIYTFYSLIFVMALVGNSFVCGVVFTSIRKWTVTNYFIANMAAGDILMALFCIPFTFVPTLVLLYWPFGEAMCRIVSFSQAVSVFVSAYTMVAISGDRYLALVYPLRPRMTRRQAKVIIGLVWLVAILTALPIILVSELSVPQNSKWHRVGNRPVCQESWTRPEQQWQYTMALLILQYCIPLTILVYSYGRIAVEVWGKKAPGEAHHHRDLRIAQSKRKIIKMMIVVVVVFALCWLPLNMLQILGEVYPSMWSWKRINYMLFACHWLAMSHSVYNPLIYCCFNSKFRQGFRAIAVRCGCSCLGGSNPVGRDTEPLQRVNTFTTYTCTGSLHSKKGSRHLSAQQQQHQLHQAAGSLRFSSSHETTEFLSPSTSGAASGARPEFRITKGNKFVFRASFVNSPQQQQQFVNGGQRCVESQM